VRRILPFTSTPLFRSCIAQYVFLRINPALFNLANLGTNGNHGIDEAIQFSQAFGFGRLDHQGTCYREAHGWRMEAIVHQTLGDRSEEHTSELQSRENR